MPTLSSMTIIFLFCIFLHSCNGRNLRVEINEASHKKQLQDRNKENDQNVISSLLNKLDDAERGSKVEQIRINDSSQKQSDSEAIAEEMKEQRMLIRSEDGVLHHGHGSLGSVSFRVPRNNEGLDHHPAFNLDYSPPKTHPPIHN